MNTTTLNVQVQQSEHATQTVQFIQAQNSISALINGEMKLFTRKNPYFDLLSLALTKDPVLHMRSPEELLQSIAEGNISEHRLVFEGVEYPVEFAALISKVRRAGGSLDPLVNFAEKVKNSPLRDRLIALLVAKQIELTWQGDLVMYTRASWLKHGIGWGTSIQKDTFVPMTRMEFGDRPAPVGSFSFINGACSDRGAIFDVVVNPEHITDINNDHLAYGAFGDYVYASEYLLLSKLEEKSAPENHGVAVVYRQTDDLGTHLIRAPYNADTARAYLEASLSAAGNVQHERLDATPLSPSGC